MFYSLDSDQAVAYGVPEAVFIRNVMETDVLSLPSFGGAVPSNVKVLCTAVPFFSTGQMSACIASLILQGVIDKFTPPPTQIKEYVAKRRRRAVWAECAYTRCEWCGEPTPILHEHHYPTKKSMGGEETVSICPNCHTEYHFIEAGLLSLTGAKA